MNARDPWVTCKWPSRIVYDERTGIGKHRSSGLPRLGWRGLHTWEVAALLRAVFIRNEYEREEALNDFWQQMKRGEEMKKETKA